MRLAGLEQKNVGTRARKAVVMNKGGDVASDHAAKLKEQHHRSAGGDYSSLRCYLFLLMISAATFITVHEKAQSSESGGEIYVDTDDDEDGTGKGGGQTTSNTQQQTALSRRFPEFGTTAFAQHCPWAMPLPEKQNCTILVRPIAEGGSGVADWTSKVVKGFMEAQLTGCRLLVDYSEGVNLQQVLVAPSSSREEGSMLDWTVPKGFECDEIKNCARVAEWTRETPKPHMVPPVPFYVNAPAVPFYRLNLRNNTHPDGSRRNGTSMIRKRAQFAHLEQILPGFQLEQGFPCSWGSMFQLAPAAAQFEPYLFTTLLPTLRNPEALVLSVSVRTGFSDHVEKNETRAHINTRQYETAAEASVKCALKLEKDFLEGQTDGFPFSRIVWMLITDSTHVKRYVVEMYDAKDVSSDGKTMWRTVLTTRSQGRHSKPSRNPSTADFAETMIDWHLHGESDVVVTNSPYASFSTTAAMRTNRPVYSYQPHGGRGCSFLRWQWLDDKE